MNFPETPTFFLVLDNGSTIELVGDDPPLVSTLTFDIVDSGELPDSAHRPAP